MQVFWIGIALTLVVFVAGPLISVRLSKNKAQKRAVLIAFGVLFLLWACYLVFSEVLNQQAVAPFLAVACVIIPLVIYFAIMQLEQAKAQQTKDAQKEAQIDDQTARMKTVTWQEVIKEQEDKRVAASQMKKSPQEEGSVLAIEQLPNLPDLTPIEDYQLRPEESSDARLMPERSKSQTEAEYKKLIKTVEHVPAEKKPSADTERSKDTQPLKTYTPSIPLPAKPHEVAQKTDDALAAAVPPAVQKPGVPLHDTKGVSQPSAEDKIITPQEQKDTTQVLPVQEKTSAVTPTKDVTNELQKEESARVSYDSCFAKAQAFAAKGVWQVAGALYEESTGLATTPAQKAQSRYAAMTAFLKAKRNADVLRLVNELQTDKNLSPAEATKIAAIKKMLS